MTRPLILASMSPYRRALLERLGVSFSVESPRVRETSDGPPRDVALENARRKADAVAQRHPDAIVIGSDQVVSLDGEVLGKPGTRDAARAQLRRLAGREHELLTAVVVADRGSRREHVEPTRLRMRPLADAEIADYVSRDDPVDCAGSYKIERLGISLFERIEGDDPTAIEGLPLMATVTLLNEAGVRALAG